MESHAAEREAGISKLPPPILHHILSFLSLEESVKTCALSKSWRYLGSTRPKFSLDDFDFEDEEEKFRNVLDKSLQVYSDQKLSIEDFNLSMSMDCLQKVSLLQKWIPLLIHDIGVKKLHLSFGWEKPTNLESESLQIKNLQINCVGNNKNLKILHLEAVDIEEESFGKIMSSCPLIESLYLEDCKGLRTINVQNHHNLDRFELFSNKDDGRSIKIYLPSCIGLINIVRCPNWFHHRKYFPRLTCLWLTNVPLSNEWFNSLSRNFPCLEELWLSQCNGFDEFQLSSRSIKKLDITMATNSTIKATLDTPSMKDFVCETSDSQSAICFSTTPNEWKYFSQTHLSLNKKEVSLYFLNLSLTSLRLERVALSNEWFDSFSRNFPCIEELQLSYCSGFDEFQLSSRSIKYLYISMHESTTKATINAPSIKMFYYHANISQSISFTATTSDEWNSQIGLSLDQLDASQWFLKLSELIAAFSQSHINSLLLYHHYGRWNNQHNIEHLSNISVCCSNSYTPVAVKSLDLCLNGLYYDSFFSDLMIGLFRIIRPSEIEQNWYGNAQQDPQGKKNEAFQEFMCRTLQMGRWEEDEGMRSFFWQKKLEQVSLQVRSYGFHEEWHPVEEGITTSWSEYVAALLQLVCKLRFLLKWRE